MPGFDDELLMATPVFGGDAAWPSIAWEKDLLDKAGHPVLPGSARPFH